MRIWIRHFVRWDYKNMLNQFSRTELLLGKAAMERLAECRVAVFGIGGVGGYVCEALARSGIGAFDLIDDDRICLTNINRQIIATRKTVGRYKADVMMERILEINPAAEITTHKCFFLPENASAFPFEKYDYVVDAIDTVTAKLELVLTAQRLEIPIISCMGAGNKLDPTAFRVADIYKTKVDPLARVMRRELKKRGVKKLKVVYSEEQPIRPIEDMAISCRSLSGGYLAYLRDTVSSDKQSSEIQPKAENSIRRKYHKQLFTPFAKACKQYQLIQEGDHIAVCISGGKDSMLMAKLFQEIQKSRVIVRPNLT